MLFVLLPYDNPLRIITTLRILITFRINKILKPVNKYWTTSWNFPCSILQFQMTDGGHTPQEQLSMILDSLCEVTFKPTPRECVRNLDMQVQVHPGELWVSKQQVHLKIEASKSVGAKGDVQKICGFVQPLHPC